jgi:hypothetical protein
LKTFGKNLSIGVHPKKILVNTYPPRYGNLLPLRLNGQNLKKQVAKYCGKNQAETPAPSDFIELTCKPPIAAAECTIELSDQKGIKMRMTFKGNHKLDIPGLISSFRAESR